MPGVHACRQVGCGYAAELRSEQRARPFEVGQAPRVRLIVRNNSITNRSSGVKRAAVCLVRLMRHRPLEPRSDVRIAVGRLQLCGDVVDHVAPLAER